MGNFEEFLIEASKKIDGLIVSTDTGKFDDYSILTINFDNKDYKIRASLVHNFDSIYKRMNKEIAQDGKINPYENMGSIKAIDLNSNEEILDKEESVSELLESIVAKIYEKYNYLVLPPAEEVIDNINPEEYINSDNYTVSDIAQETTSSQKLYSMSFKIKAESEQTTEYFPLKVYFRYAEKDGQVFVDIAEEINAMEKSTVTNVLTNRSTSAANRKKLEQMFENGEFEKDKEKLTNNLEKIINGLLEKISAYVDKFDDAPDWFKSSKLGKYIEGELLRNQDPDIKCEAAFRYITQTPLPYSYVSVTFRNRYGKTYKYDIKSASKKNAALNSELNKCPICGAAINASNKLVSSNEYDDKYIGCSKCMTEICKENDCNAIWSINQDTTAFFRLLPDKRFVTKASRCNSPFCNTENCTESPLCSLHAKHCDDVECQDNNYVYCQKVMVKCSNPLCTSSFCKVHAGTRLYKCETSECASKKNPNMYCEACKNENLYVCSFCGKTMCDDCSNETLDLINGNLQKSSERVCIDCYRAIMSGENKEVNKKNEAVRKYNGNNFYPLSAKYLYPYKDINGQYIFNAYAAMAYYSSKEAEKKENETMGKLYYHKSEVVKCDRCKELFYKTDFEKDENNEFDKTHHYCADCLKVCSVCNMPRSIDRIFIDGDNYFCNNHDCYGINWNFSDLNVNDNEIDDKETKIEESFKSTAMGIEYGLIPARVADLFKCPQSGLNVLNRQTKICPHCANKYSITQFNEEANECVLCQRLEFTDPDERKINTKLFYSKKYGNKSSFKSVVTPNMIVMEYDKFGKKVKTLVFDKKKGIYTPCNDVAVSAKESEEA